MTTEVFQRNFQNSLSGVGPATTRTMEEYTDATEFTQEADLRFTRQLINLLTFLPTLGPSTKDQKSRKPYLIDLARDLFSDVDPSPSEVEKKYRHLACVINAVIRTTMHPSIYGDIYTPEQLVDNVYINIYRESALTEP